MNDLDNKLEDTRRQSLIDPQNKIDICEEERNKAVNKAIYTVFPKEIKEVRILLEKYSQAINSDILVRFQNFDFENLDIQMNKLKDIDTSMGIAAYGVKELTEKIIYEKNSIDKISKEWMKEIDEQGRSNIYAIEVADKGINQIKNKMREIEKSKNSILNLTNILLVGVGAVTAYNTYYLFS